MNAVGYPVNTQILENLKRDIHVFFDADKFFKLSKDQIDTLTRDFLALYPSRPLENNTGGCGLVPCYWLFVVARWLQPDLIVESGIWQGQTLWLWRATCPGAEIHGFDIDLNNLKYRDVSIAYHGKDWADFPVRNLDPEKALVFFDDHVNHAKRIQEAHKKGFQWLIFDDNVDPTEFWKVGIPPAPTIRMLLDRNIESGTSFFWEVKGKEQSYVFREQDCTSARLLIDCTVEFPTATKLTLVKLKGIP
jgi:hypothetical protein